LPAAPIFSKERGVLARLPRPFAILVAMLLLAVSVWCLTASPPPIKIAKKGGYTDVHLYHDIAAAVQAGQPYHAAAAAMHRAHHYPLKPFFTMRLPTLSQMAAHFGWHGVQKIAFGLGFIAIFVWVIAVDGRLHWTEQVLIGGAMMLGVSMVFNEGLMALHEYWGGLFIGIALAGVVGWPRKWWAIALPIACGLAIRETVLPFALLALAFALYERRGKEAAGWLAVIAGFGVYMAIHAHLVAAQVLPGDIPSPGWHAMQGFSGFLKAVVFTSALQPLPLGLALLAATLPMFGWFALDGRAGVFSVLLWTGYAVMIGAFSRPDTFYWGAIMLPGYFVGFALLPRAFWQLSQAMLGKPACAL